MSKHAVEMSPAEQQRAIDIGREVAVEFDRLGAEYDERNTFPLEVVPLFKQSGLPALVVPKALGGMGADILTLARVTTELSRGDPAIALAFNMHLTMVAIFSRLFDLADQERWFAPIVSDGALVCAPLSEERAGLTGLADTVAVPRPGGGWSISGRKSWSTLCEAADIVCTNATITEADGALPDDVGEHVAREFMFMFAMDTPGIRIERTWDALGMRATGTHTLVYEDVVVGPEARVRDFRGGLFGEFEWAAASFAAVYQGLLEKAYDETLRILEHKVLGATMEGRENALRDQGHVQHGLGRMVVAREASERVLESTCRLVAEGRDAGWDPVARVAYLEVTKVMCTEYAMQVVDQGMRLVGGSAFRRGHVLERLYRDVRSGPFHPMTTDQVYTTLGRSELGLFRPAAQPAAPAPA